MKQFFYRVWTKVKEAFYKPPTISPRPEQPPISLPPEKPQPGKDTVNDGSPKNPDWTYLWDNCKIDMHRFAEINGVCLKILKNKYQYQVVETATNVPWFLIAALHYRESGMDFDTYLHNGERLGKTTRLVPKGIFFPKGAWIEAAIHALKFDGLDKVGYKSIVTCLVVSERFNGLGYRKKSHLSPYVWAGTNQSDETGKYKSDGVYSSSAKEAQLGVAAIFKGLQLLDEDLSL